MKEGQHIFIKKYTSLLFLSKRSEVDCKCERDRETKDAGIDWRTALLTLIFYFSAKKGIFPLWALTGHSRDSVSDVAS